MATSYSTKDSTKDATKDATDTYVRSSDNTTSESTKATGKGKNIALDSSDKSHDNDNITSSYGKTQAGSQGQWSSSSQQQQHNGGGQSRQFGLGHDSDAQYGRGSQQNFSPSDVQQKLKEVGNLLQKAGHLLQDLQCCSSSDIQPSSFQQRGPGGNYSGPYGGFESHQLFGSQGPQYGAGSQYGYSAGQSSQWGRPSGEWGQGPSSRYESERGQQYGGGRWSEQPEERGISGRGGLYGSRNEDRFENRSSVDRFGGFGGPNRPDLAYGQQYGSSSLGFEGRRGGDFSYESRRGGDRF